MVAVPILSGITADGAEFATSYPVNLVPVPKTSGVSDGFLRPADGIVSLVDAGGIGRGGVRWRNNHYRVSGATLYRVTETGSLTSIGPIAGTDFCTFAESFDHLAINGGGNLYLFDGATLAQVTDVDLGVSLDVEWTNGYFFSTDGEFIVSSDLSNPFSWNTLRYASSEASPDPVLALQKIRNEIYALNRYTIEVFGAISNPGLLFPFGRIEGAQVMKGAIGSRACTVFSDALAFVGGGVDESPAVWIASGGEAQRLSTREIDNILRGYTDEELAATVMESRVDRDQALLYIHLPRQSLVFDASATAKAGAPVWFILASVAGGYRGRGFVWCHSRWYCADPFGSQIGYLSDDVGSHYGDPVAWQFTTPIIYGGGRGVQVHELELVAITGGAALGDDPKIGVEYSDDGATWSQPRYISAGQRGQRAKRMAWARQGAFRNWRVYRFTGDSRAHMSFARLEATVEALSV